MRGYEGYSGLEYTVTTSGDVAEIQTIECSPRGGNYYYRNGNHLFENPSIQSLIQTTYSPRMVDGIPAEVKGVQRKFLFVSIQLPRSIAPPNVSGQ